MAYTIEYCDNQLDQKLDKMGSDYFSLPIKLMQFRKATWDIIRESTVFSEATQEISDDIHTLVGINYQVMTQLSGTNAHYWECSFPASYHRLISTTPLFYPSSTPASAKTVDPNPNDLINDLIREVKITKLGQENAFNRSPNKKAEPEYPLVLRLSEKLRFNFGIDDGTQYVKAKIVYYSEPEFGDENDLSNIIVNLPKLTIEKIMDRTASALRMITGDEHAQLNYQFDQTFGKRKG